MIQLIGCLFMCRRGGEEGQMGEHNYAINEVLVYVWRGGGWSHMGNIYS